jgi:hypothetical protein
MLLSLTTKTPVPAGKAASIIETPMVPFLPDRLIVSRVSSPYFRIHSLAISRICYVDGGASGLPAKIFEWTNCSKCGASEACGGAEIDFADLEVGPGYNVVLTVENIDCIDHHFESALEGRQSEYESLRLRRVQRAELMLEARLYIAVGEAIETLRSRKAKWPDSASEVASKLEAALKRVQVKP